MTLYRMDGIESARTALETARSEYEERLKSRPNDILVTGLLGVVVAALGEKERATEIGNRALELSGSPEPEIALRRRALVRLTLIYTLFGEYDQAFDYLDRMLTLGTSSSLHFYANDSDFAELRRHPRWNDFAKKHTLEVAAR